MRAFLHVDDLGDACVFSLEQWQPGADDLQHLNVGTEVDISIHELAELVASSMGYEGRIIWDFEKPDDTPKKQLDVNRLASLGWKASIDLEKGVDQAIGDFTGRAVCA